MKFITSLMLMIAMVLISLVLSAGCIPVVPDEPDPIPTPILSAEVYGTVWNEQGDVCCYITNDGDIDIEFYELTFDVGLEYHQPIEPVIILGEDLDVGDTDKVCIEFMCPVCEDTNVDSVIITYELWE